jgi:hypothetical protein
VVRAGLFGPRLSAQVAWLKTRGRLSYRYLREYLREVLRLTVSSGYLVKVVRKTAACLRPTWKELNAQLRHESRLHVDETGHTEAGRKLWTWVFRAAKFAVYRIVASRGAKVLRRVLGRKYRGILCIDYFSAYRKYIGEHNVLAQFCLAHFIRDVRFLTTLPDPATHAYGRQVEQALRRLFGVIHRRAQYAAQFQHKLEQARDRLKNAVLNAPLKNEPQNLAERFRQHGDDYLRFVTTPGLEPTNNLAEQALRFIVWERRLTQGTRTARGRETRETLWTVLQTCAQQERSFYQFLVEALSAHFRQQAVPSLLPAAP